ncbi:MAG: hypothetical protein QY311_02565 [Candidatus Paceibacterota bacterium]|nr:MAG: hypothetical protein QY311_02565 [Candidatus Paceibacterota bacterium]
MMTGLEIELLDGSRVILAGRAQDVGQPGYMFLMRGDEIEALEDPNLRPKVERILAGKCEVLWKCRDFSDDAAICLAARMRDRRRFLDSKLTALRVLDEEREEYLRGDVPF